MRDPWDADEDELPDGDYRCIRCGAGFEREYHECPECGGAFLAPVDGD